MLRKTERERERERERKRKRERSESRKRARAHQPLECGTAHRISKRGIEKNVDATREWNVG